MALYTYIAEDESGLKQSGTLDAETYDQAREMLRRKDLTIVSLAEFTLSEDDPLPVESMPWAKKSKPIAEPSEEETTYLPLIETLRLFAGWLLAWYGLVYLLGGLQIKHSISEDIPFISALFSSGLVLRFSFATFVFLLLTSLHAWMGKGIAKGIVLTLVGIAMIAGFHFYA